MASSKRGPTTRKIFLGIECLCIFVGVFVGYVFLSIVCDLVPKTKDVETTHLRASAAVGGLPQSGIPLSNIRVVDADTIEADLSLYYTTPEQQLPFLLSIPEQQHLVLCTKTHIRVRGANAYELSTLRGREASFALQELMPHATAIFLQDIGGGGGRDKYGRILGEVVLVIDGEEVKLSEWIITNKYGVPY